MERETGSRGRDSAQILAGIGRRRARIDSMLGELEQRLSPASLINQAIDALEGLVLGRDTPSHKVTVHNNVQLQPLPHNRTLRLPDTGETLAQISDIIRRNPVPVVLIGIGIAWLGISLARDPRPRRQAGGPPMDGPAYEAVDI